MPQMSPIYWLFLLMYFIIMLVMLIVFIFFPLHSMKLLVLSSDNSLIWMW